MRTTIRRPCLRSVLSVLPTDRANLHEFQLALKSPFTYCPIVQFHRLHLSVIRPHMLLFFIIGLFSFYYVITLKRFCQYFFDLFFIFLAFYVIGCLHIGGGERKCERIHLKRLAHAIGCHLVFNV